MSETADELQNTADVLREISRQGERPAVLEPVRKLEAAAARAARAWSGSSIGYHACVYYRDLELPPPGEHFSSEWGLSGMFHGTTGNWREYRYDYIRDQILKNAGSPDLGPAKALATEAESAFENAKTAIDSILSLADDDSGGFLAGLRQQTADLRVLDADTAARVQLPRNVTSRDATAMSQGLRVAPHQELIGVVVACRSPVEACAKLAGIAEKAASHLNRVERKIQRESRMSGTSVFIGHGRSPLWRELKDFIQDRLQLPWDEFNRVPVAGVTNVERLVQMLDDAAVALLVLTAEDEREDGVYVARQNVVHEAGLFQGRLGFTRAIVLLEDGCDEFSNIAGLGQIRFPAGNIAASFEEIRRVLEREELVSS